MPNEHGGSVTATVDPAEFVPPVAIAGSRRSAREHPPVARALAATESTEGHDPDVTVTPEMTDAVALHPATGLPTLGQRRGDRPAAVAVSLSCRVSRLCCGRAGLRSSVQTVQVDRVRSKNLSGSGLCVRLGDDPRLDDP